MNKIIIIGLTLVISSCVSKRFDSTEEEVEYLRFRVTQLRDVSYEEKWYKSIKRVGKSSDYLKKGDVRCISVFRYGGTVTGLTCPASPRKFVSLKEDISLGKKCFINNDSYSTVTEDEFIKTTFIKIGKPATLPNINQSRLFILINGKFLPTYIDKVNDDKYLIETVSSNEGPSYMKFFRKAGIKETLLKYKEVDCQTLSKLVPELPLNHLQFFGEFLPWEHLWYDVLSLDEEFVKMIRQKGQ